MNKITQSPMLIHAIESFEHGLEHYFEGSDKSRKFAVLHIDQSIELLLKERVIQLGKSIYTGQQGTTLNFHQLFKSLKDIKIPEQPRLEELHDLRNSIQHKGVTPDLYTTQFFVKVAYRFVKRFLAEELDMSVGDILPKEYRALMEGQPLLLKQNAEIVSAFRNAQQASKPTDQIVMGYTVLSRVVDVLTDSNSSGGSFRQTLRFTARGLGAHDKDIKIALDIVMRLRNQVVHTDYLPTANDAKNFIEAVQRLLEMVGCNFQD